MTKLTTIPLLTLLAGLLSAAPAPARAQEIAHRQLTLDEALALAARKNLDLSLARQDVDLAETDVTRAFSGYLPRLDLTASTGRTWLGAQQFEDIRGVGLTEPTENDDFSTTLALSQPLFQGFRTVNDVRSARALERAERHLFTETELAVAFDVTQRFLELVKAERSLAVLEENARRSAELVERADALFTAGKMPKNDTIQARVNLGNDQIAVQNQRVTIQLRRSSLATALGLPADELLKPVPPPALDAAALPSGEPPPLEALVETARQRRPLLASDAATVEAAEAAVGAARADWFPQLSARASYTRGVNDLNPTDAFDAIDEQYSANAGLVLSWNLFEGRLTQANVQRASINERRARTNSERNRLLVAQQLADSRAGVVWLTQTVKLAAANLAIAEQGVELSRQRLEAGLLSQLEARDAQLKLTQSQLALVEARIDHAIAVANLNRAVGGAL